jgi:FkbM family methyltransferase
MNVIDVGTNVGLYSILADKLVAPGGTIWAFEPSAETYQRLLKNLELNHCATVKPHKIALSDADGEFCLLRTDRGYGDAYRYLANTPSGDGKRKNQHPTKGELVPVFSLDWFAQHHGIKRVHLIKVDIEGGEYRFFQGARQFLSSNQDVLILFENSPDWAERAGHKQTDVWTLLMQLGFQLYAWDPRHKKFSQRHSKLASAEMLWACRHPQLLPKA